MAAVDDPKTFGRARTSFADLSEVEEFAATLDKFERGEITADQWKAFRLVRGTYAQRQTGDAQMLRVKIPQGILTAEQLRAIADVASRYSRGFCHITTRQNIQLHFVKLQDVELAMERLARAGLTTREACGNSVRNITACPYAGVSHDEVFDVTPYAEAMTRHLLRHPLSSSLPRKFKIAFEGCPEDHAFTGINDIGFRAKVRTGRTGSERGFAVAVAGGTSTVCTEAKSLYDFLPTSEILEVAEAVVMVFHRLGDRQHRQRNRLKFLVKQLGWDGFRTELEKARAELAQQGGVPLTLPEPGPVEEAPKAGARPAIPSVEALAAKVASERLKGPGLAPTIRPRTTASPERFARWAKTNRRDQKQPGYACATATLCLGDITSEQLSAIADLSSSFADGTARITPGQNILLRWVGADRLEALHQRLEAAGLGDPDADTVADVVSCPGAESCRLAVTQSRGLGKLLSDHLRANPALVAKAPDLQIKISGCPNGCGQHHIAGIGFQGSIRRLGDKLLPQYFVMVGGGPAEGKTTFGRLAAKVPARRIPQAVEALIGLYTAEGNPSESATAFFQRVDLQRVKAVLSPFEPLPLETAKPEDFVDLGEQAEFKPETMEGECAA